MAITCSVIPTYNGVLVLAVAFAIAFTLILNVHNACKIVLARKGNILLALAMLFPFAFLVGGVLVWDYLSPSDIMNNYPNMVVIGTGLAFGYIHVNLRLKHSHV